MPCREGRPRPMRHARAVALRLATGAPSLAAPGPELELLLLHLETLILIIGNTNVKRKISRINDIRYPPRMPRLQPRTAVPPAKPSPQRRRAPPPRAGTAIISKP